MRAGKFRAGVRPALTCWLLAGVFCTGTTGRAAAQNAPEAERSQAAADVLQHWYEPTSGVYRSTGWWNSANAITALANFSRVTGSREYLPVFANTLAAARAAPDDAPGFLNKYYDDEGWWALAWIDVFDLTGEMRYLQAARGIFKDMQGGWETEACGGGVWWSKDQRDKNAIENELFLAVAASLANREPDAPERKQDLEWAEREWRWFQGTGMINADYLINDGVDISNPAQCRNNGKATWSYNQGVILGALIELNEAAPNPELLRTAKSIADAALNHLTDAHGVLREPNDAHTGGDVPQFKGIFVRNLMLLQESAPDARYRRFITTNADSLVERDRNAAGQYGFFWTGPVDEVDAARQSSALDLLTAADSLNPPAVRAEYSPRDEIVRSARLDVVYIGDSITYGVLLDHPETQAPSTTASDWIRQTMPGSAVFFSNQGHSGHTTADFLPATGTDLPEAESAAKDLLSLHPGTLVFSVMLGTNDSAQTGPRGAPVSPQQFTVNLRLIFRELLRKFPQATIVVQRPLWYSPNTHNHSDYEQPGLDRLQTYFPAIEAVVEGFARTDPGHVVRGDTEGFEWFEKHALAQMNAEPGVNGTFYLHPNATGARALGYFWGSAIVRAMRRSRVR